MSSAPPTEPTNAELAALMHALRGDLAAANAQQQQAHGELRGEVSAIRAKVYSLEAKVVKTERDIAAVKREHDGLAGSLFAEVGALAANDREQNAKLDAIQEETAAQSAVLATVVVDTKKAIASDVMAAFKDAKKAARKYAAFCVAALVTMPKLWEGVDWLWHLVHKAVM